MRMGLDIAVIGGGIAGLSAAWRLSTHHRVTLMERLANAGLVRRNDEPQSAPAPAPRQPQQTYAPQPQAAPTARAALGLPIERAMVP